jgi:hypothetical protein
VLEFAHHAYSAQLSIDHGGEALAAEVIDDTQDAEATTVA